MIESVELSPERNAFRNFSVPKNPLWECTERACWKQTCPILIIYQILWSPWKLTRKQLEPKQSNIECNIKKLLGKNHLINISYWILDFYSIIMIVFGDNNTRLWCNKHYEQMVLKPSGSNIPGLAKCFFCFFFSWSEWKHHIL